jgi:hypothetical protein
MMFQIKSGDRGHSLAAKPVKAVPELLCPAGLMEHGIYACDYEV